MGIFTINSAIAALLGYDPAVPGTACADYPSGSGQITPTYLPTGETLISASVLWSEYDAIGVGTIFKGWYSDGTVYRYYSESNVLVDTYGYCGGEPTSVISLGESNVDDATACTNFGSAPTSFYIPIGETLMSTNRIFSDAGGTTFANEAWYSDGTNWRRWSGGQLGFTTNGSC